MRSTPKKLNNRKKNKQQPHKDVARDTHHLIHCDEEVDETIQKIHQTHRYHTKEAVEQNDDRPNMMIVTVSQMKMFQHQHVERQHQLHIM